MFRTVEVRGLDADLIIGALSAFAVGESGNPMAREAHRLAVSLMGQTAWRPVGEARIRVPAWVEPSRVVASALARLLALDVSSRAFTPCSADVMRRLSALAHAWALRHVGHWQP